MKRGLKNLEVRILLFKALINLLMRPYSQIMCIAGHRCLLMHMVTAVSFFVSGRTGLPQAINMATDFFE